MSENKLTDVPAAFEILLEEIEAEIEFINQMGCKALNVEITRVFKQLPNAPRSLALFGIK